MNNMAREKGSNYKEMNDEVANIEDPQKQKVLDDHCQITISNKEADENLESKGHKSDSDGDVKSGSNAGSDADGVTGVKRIKNPNPNRKKLQLLQRLTSLNAFFADTSEPVSLFTHEREQIGKEQQQQNYQNLHAHSNSEHAQSDMATNVADEAIKTKEKNEKSE